MDFLIFIGTLILVGIIMSLAVWQEKYAQRKRTEALSQLAEELNFSFRETGIDLLEKLLQYQSFRVGKNRSIRNVMVKSANDMTVQILDFSYVTGSGKNKQTHNQTIQIVTAEDLQMPAFALRPEHFGDWVAGVFGYDDIDLPNAPEFSKAFYLSGKDVDALTEFLNPEILDYLVNHKSLCIVGDNQTFYLYTQNGFLSPDKYHEQLEIAFELLGLFRRYSRISNEI